MWYPDNQVRKNTQFVHTTTSKQKHPLQESDKNTKYVLVWPFKYDQLHMSAKTTEIKLLKF